jgi:hypothetical protein
VWLCGVHQPLVQDFRKVERDSGRHRADILAQDRELLLHGVGERS